MVPETRTDLPVARKMWRTLEPFHGMIYFAPEGPEHYERIGLRGSRMGYFASRSAPMGPVPSEVVIATFFNFFPDLVHRSMDTAWELASPADVLAARFAAADAALRRMLGEETLVSPEMEEAAALAQRATEACRPEGRPLFGGHASLAWPTAPHLVLWHAITLLREFRGDGHVAALTAEGLGGCEALVMHAATGDIPADSLKTSRAWPDREWEQACAGLRDRGWLDGEARLSRTGWEHRSWVEERTDQLASPPWEHLGAEGCDRLRALVRPWSRTISEGGTFARPPADD